MNHDALLLSIISIVNETQATADAATEPVADTSSEAAIDELTRIMVWARGFQRIRKLLEETTIADKKAKMDA